MASSHQTRQILQNGIQISNALGEALFYPAIAALGIAGLAWVAGLQNTHPVFWAFFLPGIYLAWLTLYLSLCALETALLGLVYTKPRRFDERESGTYTLPMLIALKHYNRAYLVFSLPLVYFLKQTPFFSWLIMRSFATKTHVGNDVLLLGFMADPDITFVGSHTILGDSTRIIAHNLTWTPEGKVVFQTAPILIGEHCTIGGDSLIEVGVHIGDRTIIEPYSHVTAFTRIPSDEVWGGSPAVFIRKRGTENNPDPLPCHTMEGPVDGLLPLIAHALALPESAVTASTSAADCPAWDSLGKMAIVAALHDRFGIRLDPQDVFRLDSVAAVQQAIRRCATDPGSGHGIPHTDPDFLPLQDPAAATTYLSQIQPVADPRGPEVRVVVASTFVAHPLSPAAKLWSAAWGINAVVDFADFNQVPQTLLSPDSPFHQNRTGLNVVLVRPEDLPGGQPEAEPILAAIRTFAGHTTGTLLVSDLPPTLYPGHPDPTTLTTWWRNELSQIPGVLILDFSGIISDLGRAASRDVKMAEAASAPFSPAVYQRLGIALARAARALHTPPRKVIALDGDGTLWRGVVGEDGPDGIEVAPEFRRFQETLAELQRRGILLALVSKNEPGDVRRVFEKNPGMVLRWEDFSATRINWRPKSENLRELAAELNLGTDALVFVDDNPAERLEVGANCPEVAVVPLPSDPALFAETLGRLWLFDGAGTTPEDRARKDYMRHDSLRREAREKTNDLQSYLRGLELVVEIRQAGPGDWDRVSQLSLKTNQFNFSLKRYPLPELRAAAETREIWTLSMRDKFGDYGLVGGAVGALSTPGYILDAVFVSCRALGRGAEEVLLHGIAKHAQKLGAGKLVAAFKEGPRNHPAGDFLAKQGFQAENPGLFARELGELPPYPAHLRPRAD